MPTGCNTTAVPAKDAIGIDDPTNATNPSAVQTVIGDLAKPNNYIGANSAPDVVNANLGNLTAAQLNQFVGQVASVATNVYGTPSAPVNNPTINLGTAANPAIDVVYGNYSMGPSTGYGILVVTGTLTFSGNYAWNGLILVIGNGASIMNGGGNGQIVGSSLRCQYRRQYVRLAQRELERRWRQRHSVRSLLGRLHAQQDSSSGARCQCQCASGNKPAHAGVLSASSV